MAMLHGVLKLHDIDDVERFCHRILDNHSSKVRLTHEDLEDAIQYLVAECWQLAERFESGRNSSFSKYAYGILSFRVTDWIRLDEGRTKWQFSTHTYERAKPTVVSFDAPVHSSGDSGDSGRLGELVAAHDGGGPSDPDQVLAGLLRSRDREARRDKHYIRSRGYQRVA